MPEPVTGTGATTLMICDITIVGITTSINAGVIIGAFASAVIFKAFVCFAVLRGVAML